MNDNENNNRFIQDEDKQRQVHLDGQRIVFDLIDHASEVFETQMKIEKQEMLKRVCSWMKTGNDKYIKIDCLYILTCK